MPVIHIVVLLTPKKKAILPPASMLFRFVSNIAVHLFFYKVVNNQTPSLRQDVSLLRENINIFPRINVIYLYMLHICIYKIYSMIQLLCTKVKFCLNICLESGFITFNVTHDLYFEYMKVLGISLSRCFATVSTFFYFSTATCSGVA